MTPFWAATLGLGLLTFLIRYSFLGLFAGAAPSPMAMRVLRFVPVTVLPAMIGPMVLGPNANEPDKVIAAMVAVMVGIWLRRLLLTILCGMGALLLIRFVL